LRSSRSIIAALLIIFAGLAGTAMLRNSATFDEIIFPAAGARGLATGDFNLVRDHPPVMQYVYGLPVWLLGVHYPPEADRTWDHMARYHYARAMLWGYGNVPEQVIASARLASVLIGAILVWATYGFSRRPLGSGPALLAAGLVAFLPDVLAHSGVTYNDVPLALAVFVTVHLLDRAVRDPSMRNIALAAFASAVTVGIKSSGMAVVPILGVLLMLEAASGRWKDAAWTAAIARGIPVYAVVVYATLVAIYRGDFRLENFLDGVRVNLLLNAAGRPALFLGRMSDSGFWYFYPGAFLLKTPAALHGLALVAIAGAVIALRRSGRFGMLAHPLRATWVATLVFGAMLMTTKVNIGFRHALPILPFVCVLIAAGVAIIWRQRRIASRALVVGLVAWNVVSVARHYPYFLSYVSEYAAGRPLYETLVDSSTDWGQGLFALHDFMRERHIDQVYLSYFGSALPEGYRIKYASLPSFLELPAHAPDPAAPPRYIAVSATHLAGLYVDGDPFKRLRGEAPVAVVGGSIWIFDLAR
jgi:hypothetical protein